MIKAILFDLGDTVFNPDWKTMNEKMIEEGGISIIMPKDIKEIYNNEVLVGKSSMEKIIEKLLKSASSKKTVKESIEAYKRNYEKYSPINEKVFNLIKELKKKYKIMALSNTNEIHKEVNQKRGLFTHFEKVFLSFEMGIRKPDKKIFSIILEDTHLKPEEVILIDDNEGNIKTASEMGFKTIIYKGYEELIKSLKALGSY